MGAILSIYAIHHLSADYVTGRKLQKIITLCNYEKSMKDGHIGFEKADQDDPRKCIHLTYEDDTQEKIEKFFFGVKVVVLNLDMEKLTTYGFRLVEETNKDGGNIYPHLYHHTKMLKPIPWDCISRTDEI
jgi:uncharacterized protein (DUF952 family)